MNQGASRKPGRRLPRTSQPFALVGTGEVRKPQGATQTAPRENVAIVAGARKILAAALMVFGIAGAFLPGYRGGPAGCPANRTSAAAAAPNMAPPQLIAMMPFDGRTPGPAAASVFQPNTTATAVAETLAARPQARFYKVLEPNLWAGMARLRNHGKSTDVRAVARLIKANLVVGGWDRSNAGSGRAQALPTDADGLR